MSKKHTKEEFIALARKVHGNKYDYSKVSYTTNKIPVCIICPEHGIFFQRPDRHLQGIGCPECGKKLAIINRVTPFSKFLEKASNKFGNQFEYDQETYKNLHTKLKITCKICGTTFWQVPKDHLRGCLGCRCSKNARLDTDEFIKRAKESHGEEAYNYSKVTYTNNRTKVEISCNSCGCSFWQTPDAHVQGQGCPRCHNSRGEELCCLYLKEKGIEINPKSKISIGERSVIPDITFIHSGNKYWIEYNGIQHYEHTDRFHSNGFGLEDQIKRDSDVRKYCRQNNIILIEIPYTIRTLAQVTSILDEILFNEKSPNQVINYKSLYKL